MFTEHLLCAGPVPAGKQSNDAGQVPAPWGSRFTSRKHMKVNRPPATLQLADPTHSLHPPCPASSTPESPLLTSVSTQPFSSTSLIITALLHNLPVPHSLLNRVQPRARILSPMTSAAAPRPRSHYTGHCWVSHLQAFARALLSAVLLPSQ